MYVNHEIATLFPHCIAELKKRGNFKLNIHLDSVESFLHYLSSRYNIVNVSNKFASNIVPHCRPHPVAAAAAGILDYQSSTRARARWCLGQ